MGSGRRLTRAELGALLDRAGLETVGEWGPENVLTPAAAWRPVISYHTVPTATVRDDRPDLVPALNTQWHRLAREHGIIDDKGEFLVHVANSDTWARVRLAPAWDLAGVLGDRPGQPEFVTLSVDGDALLGVTSEEYEVWLVAVTGVGERREEEARAAARETSEEREAAWEGLRDSRLRPTRWTWGTWVDWLGFNDAASDEVLIRLLGLGVDSFLHRTSSAAVLDAAVAHQDPRIRAAAGGRGEARPHPEPIDRASHQALDDPESTPGPVERFSRDVDGEVRLRAATDPRLSAASAVRLLDDGSAAVRHAAARHPALPARALVRALRDRELVRDAVMNPALPDSVMHWMIDTAVAGLEEQRP